MLGFELNDFTQSGIKQQELFKEVYQPPPVFLVFCSTKWNTNMPNILCHCKLPAPLSWLFQTQTENLTADQLTSKMY